MEPPGGPDYADQKPIKQQSRAAAQGDFLESTDPRWQNICGGRCPVAQIPPSIRHFQFILDIFLQIFFIYTKEKMRSRIVSKKIVASVVAVSD